MSFFENALDQIGSWGESVIDGGMDALDDYFQSLGKDPTQQTPRTTINPNAGAGVPNANQYQDVSKPNVLGFDLSGINWTMLGVIVGVIALLVSLFNIKFK